MDDKGKDVTRSSPLPIYTAQGACGKPPFVPHNHRLQVRTHGSGRSEMRLSLSTCPAGVWL